MCEQPPLGVMPKYLYELKRIQELCRSLHEYTTYYGYTNAPYDTLISWSKEVIERLENIKRSENKND